MVKIGLLSQNLRGAKKNGLFAKMLHEFGNWRDKKGNSVLCAQEHNLSPAQQRDLERMATSKNMTVILSFAPVNQVGQHPGGVLLLLDNKTLSLKKINHNRPGFLSANVE